MATSMFRLMLLSIVFLNTKGMDVDNGSRIFHNDTRIEYDQMYKPSYIDNVATAEINFMQLHNNVMDNATSHSLMVNSTGTLEHDDDDHNGDEEEKQDDAKQKKLRTEVLDEIRNATRIIEHGDIRSLPTLNLSHCIYGYNFSFIECEFIGIALDYKPFITYDFHIQFKIVFKTLGGDSDNLRRRQYSVTPKNVTFRNQHTTDEHEGRNERSESDPLCLLRLWKVEMRKVPGYYDRENATSRFLGPDFWIFLCSSLENMYWKMEFTTNVAVALLHLHPGCTENNRIQGSCIDQVELVNFLRIAKGVNGYQSVYWEVFRGLFVGTLGGHNSSLVMDFRNKLNIPLYIGPLLNGTALSSLSLTNTYWTQMDTLLVNLPALKHLDLSNNHHTHIHTGNFLQAPNIEDLNLSSNELQTIPTGVSLLSQLKRLDVSRNKLQYGELQSSNILRNLTKLKWLLLSGTSLKSLKNLNSILCDNSYLTCVRIYGLDVSNCDISVLDDDEEFFQQQTSLQSINLSGNKIATIPSRMFLGLHQLKFLYLSHLNLTQEQKFRLELGSVLNYIDLSHNGLTSFDGILLSGRTSVLDLSYNSIKDWVDETVFLSLSNCHSAECNSSDMEASTWVDNVNMSHNIMPIVTKSMGMSLLPLKTVDLGGNSFYCINCKILEFRNWLHHLLTNPRAVRVLSLGTNDKLKCGTELKDIAIYDVNSVPDACDKELNYWVVTGIVLGSLLMLMGVIALLVLRYKFEVTYIIFLLTQKKKRKLVEFDGKFEYDAFVCYSRSNRQWVVNELVPGLENCPDRYRLCLHERDFILGSFISLNIVHAMQCSRYTLMVLSSSFINSQWCRWELEMANHKLFDSGREFLILVELEPLDQAEVPPHLRYLMDTRTYLEWPSSGTDSSVALKRLKSCLGKSVYAQNKEIAGKENTSVL